MLQCGPAEPVVGAGTLEYNQLAQLKGFGCLDLIFIERTVDPGVAVFAVQSDFVVKFKTAREESRLHTARDVDILPQVFPHSRLMIRFVFIMKRGGGDASI